MPSCRIFLFISILAAFTACGPKSPESGTSSDSKLSVADQAIKDGILIRGNGAEPQGIDPHIVTGVPENRIISSLIEGLIAYHPTDDNIPEPGVAERWEHNEDHSEWTFYLRQDAKWSNGDTVTAHDFVYSWHRMLHPDFGAKYADMLFILKNGEAYFRGEIKDFSEVGVKAVDDYTLKVDLVGSKPYYLSMLKHYSWYPVHPATVEKHGGMTALSNPWTREEFVGNGPFVLEEWVPSSILKVKKSETYWDSSTVQLNGIHFLPIEAITTEDRAFNAGEIHVTNEVPSDRILKYLDEKADQIHIDPLLTVYFYRFNVNKAPLDDVRVRKALSMSIDRTSIVERITQAGETPADAFTPPGISGYNPPRITAYDPDKARALLAEAGFPGGEGFPSDIEVLFNTHESHKAIAEAIQSMWREELGINVGILNQEWKVYINSQQTLAYTISRSGWQGDYMDPFTFLSMWTDGNGNNNTGWASEEYDDIILNQVTQETDTAKRLALLAKAESILLEESPIAPIYWYTNQYMKDTRLKGYNPKLLDNRPYKYMYFEE
ncbi:MAG: peptide ABC transporter substrate-binding protein [Opitutales bacterium]